MKLKILFLALTVALAIGCQKEDPDLPPTPCELDNWGHVHIENLLSGRFEVYFDGVLKLTIGPGSSADIMKMPAKFYRVEMKNEASGTWSFIDDFEVKACQTNLLPLVF